MNTGKVIERLISSSDDNQRSMVNMFRSGEYLWALFVGHLSVEKLLKAYYVKNIGGNYPHSHNLVKLAQASGLKLTEKQTIELNTITQFNIEARYEEYKKELYEKCTKEYTEINISTINEARAWLLDMLKEL